MIWQQPKGIFEKIMLVGKIPKILNRMMLFKREFIVEPLNYNWDTSLILFSCCIIWLDALESGVGDSKRIRGLACEDDLQHAGVEDLPVYTEQYPTWNPPGVGGSN